MSDEAFYAYMKEVDIDGDGRINFEEFEQMMLNLLANQQKVF